MRRLSKPEKYILYKERPDLDATRSLQDINSVSASVHSNLGILPFSNSSLAPWAVAGV